MPLFSSPVPTPRGPVPTPPLISFNLSTRDVFSLGLNLHLHVLTPHNALRKLYRVWRIVLMNGFVLLQIWQGCFIGSIIFACIMYTQEESNAIWRKMFTPRPEDTTLGKKIARVCFNVALFPGIILWESRSLERSSREVDGNGDQKEDGHLEGGVMV